MPREVRMSMSNSMNASMNLNLGYSCRPSLRQIPRAQLEVKVLQCDSASLDELVRLESEENPCFRVTEDVEPRATTAVGWSSRAGLGSRAPRHDRSSPVDPVAYQEDEPSIREKLLAQVGLLQLNPRERIFATFVVGNLDSVGVLRDVSLEDLATETGLDSAHAERVLVTLQRQLDPPGVAARSDSECLLIRALDHGLDESSLPVRLLRECAREFEAGELPKAAAKLGVPHAELLRNLKILWQLTPRPVAGLDEPEAQFVVPEARIERGDDGEFRVRMEDSGFGVAREDVPAHLLDDRRAASFLRSSDQRARWLIECIAKRRRTIEAVAREIVAAQHDFFEHDGDIRYLRPLTQRDVAARLGMDESKVCRTVNGKYVTTPFGVLELAACFSSSATKTGVNLSTAAAREEVRRLVEAEDPARPLSDQAIAKRLGLQVRVVNNYRNDLGILDSRARRRLRVSARPHAG